MAAVAPRAAARTDDRRDHSRRQARARSRARAGVTPWRADRRRTDISATTASFSSSRLAGPDRSSGRRAPRPAGIGDRRRLRPKCSTPNTVRLLVGRSTVVDVGTPIVARLADEPRHRRRARDVAEPAARQRQDARDDFDVRLGSRRRAAPLRSDRAARPGPAQRAAPAAVSRRADRRARATARTSCCPARSPTRT